MRLTAFLLLASQVSGCSLLFEEQVNEDAQGNADECPPDYEPKADSCYRVMGPALWPEARAECAKTGHLAVLDGVDESIVVGALHGDQEIWIGLAKSVSGDWRWLTGGFQSLDAPPWESGEPDSSDTYGVLRDDEFDGGWAGKVCVNEEPRPYVCEYDGQDDILETVF